MPDRWACCFCWSCQKRWKQGHLSRFWWSCDVCDLSGSTAWFHTWGRSSTSWSGVSKKFFWWVHVLGLLVVVFCVCVIEAIHSCMPHMRKSAWLSRSEASRNLCWWICISPVLLQDLLFDKGTDVILCGWLGSKHQLTNYLAGLISGDTRSCMDMDDAWFVD